MFWQPSEFRDLVSGRRRGLKAALLRWGLRVAETPYALAVRWRNRRYDRGAAEVCRVGVPVVSVGNLTLGGTGKTPMVEWISRWFRQHGVRVTIISRGYGAEAGGVNDEALELEQRLPDVPHVQNPNRVEAATMAIEELGCQLIVLDDAFQHRRIARDLDLVMLDATEAFGFGHVFPRGTLREPQVGLRRAHVVVLSRADMLEPAQRERIHDEVQRFAPEAVWAEAVHRPQALRNARGGERAVDWVQDKKVMAFCGIGSPGGFRRTLENCGAKVIGFREFADHYRYTRADVEALADWANTADAEAVLCTHKDLVKLGVDRLGRLPLWALTVGLEFLTGQSAVEAQLAVLLAQIPPE